MRGREWEREREGGGEGETAGREGTEGRARGEEEKSEVGRERGNMQDA